MNDFFFCSDSFHDGGFNLLYNLNPSDFFTAGLYFKIWWKILVTSSWRVSYFLFANQISISSYPQLFHVTKDF